MRRVNLSSLVKRLVVVSTVALLVSGLIWPVPTARAQTGSISGHVYDDVGDPISGANVWAEPYAGGQGEGTTTDVDGSYTIQGLAYDQYRVSAGGDESGYVRQYWQNRSRWDDADPVTVSADSDATGIDFSLEQGGIITGTVTAPDGLTAVANARVEVYNQDRSIQEGSNTDEQGIFTINGVPGGTYTLSANPPEGSLYTASVPQSVTVTAGSTTNVGVVMLTQAQITGTVKDPEGLTAVANARVDVYNQDRSVQKDSHTDEQGSFRIGGLPSGTYTLCANPPEGSDYTASVPQSVTVSDSPINVDVRLTQAQITGTVTAPDGTTPIMGARVEVYNEDRSVQKDSHTDDQGIFRLGGLPSGTYTLCANPPGEGEGSQYTGSVPQSVTVAADYSTTTVAVMLTEAQITGTVTAPDGETAVPNARVEVYNENRSVYKDSHTDEQGSFRIGGLPSGTYTLGAIPPEGSLYTGSVPQAVIVSDSPINVDVMLTQAQITGTVKDPEGLTPIMGARVEVYNQDRSVQKDSHTDDQGIFRIGGLSPGTYTLRAIPPEGSQYTGSAPQAVTVSDSPINVDVRLTQAQITGTVTAPDGLTAVANARVEVYNENRSVQEDSHTDEQGIFRIGGLSSGTYTLCANAPEGSLYTASVPQAVTVTEGSSTDVGVVMLTEAQITGTVKDPNGTAVSNVWVQVYSEDWSVQKDSHTDEQGIFRIGGLPSGTYTLRAKPPDGSLYTASMPQAVTVTEGSSTDVGDVRLTEAQITGKVTLPDGTTGVAWARVNAHSEDWSIQEGSNSDQQGNFRIGGLSPGSYLLRAEPPPDPAYGEYTMSDEAEVEVTGTSPVTATLRLNQVSVRGRVVDPDGSPVSCAGADVFSDDHSVHQNTGTDERGNFSFGGLAALTYTLEIHIPWGESGWVSPPPTSFAITDTNTIVELGDIAFIEATKFVQGSVTRSDSGEGVADVEVHANKMGAHGMWAHTTTDVQGAYSLALSSGSWELMISSRPGDPNVDWVYAGYPETVSFANDETQETKTVNFTVVTADTHVTGSVVGPNGEVLIPWAIRVEVRDNHGRGNEGSLRDDGTFAVPVAAGTYDAWIRVDEQQYPTWGSPQIAPFSVASGEMYDLGVLQLVGKNSFIQGTVTRQSDGQGIPGVEVHAWGPEAGGWGHTTTAADGTYSLAVVTGTWEVAIMPPADSNYVTGQPPRRVTVADGETVSDIDFELVEAAGTIQGTVVDSDDNLLTDVHGWAYARQGTSPEPAGGGHLENGTFSINLPAGSYYVGVGLPPDSDYTPAGEAQVEVPVAQLGSPAAVAAAYKSQVEQRVSLSAGETITVTVTLLRNDATIAGGFFTDLAKTVPAVGLEGEVFAMSGMGGAWVGTRIDPTDGSYELNVAAGTWHLGYWLRSEEYVNSPPPETRVTVDSGQVFNDMDFTVVPADYSITGTILDPGGNPLNYAWAWAHREQTETTARLDTGDDSEPPDGRFNISVPAGTYEVGAGAPEEWGYIHPDFQEVTVDASNPTEEVTLQFRTSDATITGRVYYLDQDDNRVYGHCWVWGWSEDGAHTGAPTDGEGNYRLNVTTGTTWHLGADHRYDESTFYETTQDYTVVMTGATATQDMEISQNTTQIPEGISQTFDATNPQVITLADGTEINIPAGAIATSGTVKVVITPMVEELANTLTARPFGFGYAMYAFDANDQQITGTFNRNVTISFYYTDAELNRLNVNEDDLSPAYFSTTTNSWTKVESYTVDREANRLTVQINHFSTWALTSATGTPAEPEPEGEYKIYLPLIVKNY